LTENPYERAKADTDQLRDCINAGVTTDLLRHSLKGLLFRLQNEVFGRTPRRRIELSEPVTSAYLEQLASALRTLGERELVRYGSIKWALLLRSLDDPIAIFGQGIFSRTVVKWAESFVISFEQPTDQLESLKIDQRTLDVTLFEQIALAVSFGSIWWQIHACKLRVSKSITHILKAGTPIPELFPKKAEIFYQLSSCRHF
jgi:hypothetical protein